MSKFWFFKVKSLVSKAQTCDFWLLRSKCSVLRLINVKISVFEAQNCDFWLFRSKCSVFKGKNVKILVFQGQNCDFWLFKSKCSVLRAKKCQNSMSYWVFRRQLPSRRPPVDYSVSSSSLGLLWAFPAATRIRHYFAA